MVNRLQHGTARRVPQYLEARARGVRTEVLVFIGSGRRSKLLADEGGGVCIKHFPFIYIYIIKKKKKRPELINRRGTVSYYDNIKQHASLIWQKLREFGWEILMHPS